MLPTELNTFLTAAELLSFTKTAEALYTTQPTVSRQIQLLEEAWGLPLFQRRHKKLSLTAEGVIMAEACKKMDCVLQDALTQAQRLSSQCSGELSIGFLSSLDMHETILPSMNHFGALYPNVHLRLERASYSGLRRGLNSGQFDVIFTLGFEANTLKNVSVKEIEQVDCYFVLSENHPLYGRESLEIRDLEHAQFVLPAPNESPNRSVDLKRILEHCGLTDYKIVYEPTMDSLMLQVSAGRSIALLNRHANDVFSPSYRRVPLPMEKGYELYTVAIWKRDNRNPVIPLLF